MHPTKEMRMPPGVLRKLCPLLVEGLNHWEIGQLLMLSEAAVQNYVEWLVHAFDVNSREDLLLYFLSGAQKERSQPAHLARNAA
jgi:DNA-binding NarL/FixJ family response regulator